MDGTHTKCLVINFHGSDLRERFEEIAYAAGFGDANDFSTVFRHETGQAPGEFRKRREKETPDP